MRSLFLFLIALFAAAGALAAEPDGLTTEQRAQLARDKIIVTGETWRQIFSPYIFAGQPVFITSDSVLHAYHVLLEESAAQMESRQALRIAAVLEGVLAQIKPEPADGATAEAIDRARLMLGTAARLAGSHWSGGAALDEIIAAEAKRVEAAEGLHLPAWMKPGHGLEALDYRVFIVDYGEILGGILFYDGNSYHNPRDDAPLATAVFNQAGGQFLIAGTGRPREIRVLYPWKGKEILCRGAILPFHAELCATHLTDQEWRARLDSETPPATPAWLRPILSPDTPAKKPEK